MRILAQSLLRMRANANPRSASSDGREFIEQHRSNTLKRGIIEHEPREHAFGHHLDARLRDTCEPKRTRYPTVSPTFLAERRRHPLGRRARRQPSRFQHKNFAIFHPRLFEQHQRHARGLAGARRRDQHGGICIATPP